MKESSQALEAYNAYRDMGTGRSLAKVGQQLGKSTDILERWSKAHHWQDRIATYERELAVEAEKRAKAERLADLEKMRKVRLGVATELIQDARKTLLSARTKKTADQALRALALAFETQRKDSGEPDQRIEHSGTDGGPIRFTIAIDRAKRDADL